MCVYLEFILLPAYWQCGSLYAAKGGRSLGTCRAEGAKYSLPIATGESTFTTVYILLAGKGILASVWLGIVQQDPDAVGIYRDFKWSRSNINIPSTGEWWANRYVPTATYPVSCGYFKQILAPRV